MTEWAEVLGRPCAGCGATIGEQAGEHISITFETADGPMIAAYCSACSPRLFDLTLFRQAARKVDEG